MQHLEVSCVVQCSFKLLRFKGLITSCSSISAAVDQHKVLL